MEERIRGVVGQADILQVGRIWNTLEGHTIDGWRFDCKGLFVTINKQGICGWTYEQLKVFACQAEQDKYGKGDN